MNIKYMNIKYLKNGARVSVIDEIERGVLVKNVFMEDGEYYEDGLTYLVDYVYDKSKPIQYFDSQITKCKETILQLNKEIKLLREERGRLQNRIGKAKQTNLNVNF